MSADRALQIAIVLTESNTRMGLERPAAPTASTETLQVSGVRCQTQPLLPPGSAARLGLQVPDDADGFTSEQVEEIGTEGSSSIDV
jgi:hypothetical protein